MSAVHRWERPLKKKKKKTPKYIISKGPDGKLRLQASQMKHYHRAHGRNLVPTAAVRDPGDSPPLVAGCLLKGKG